MTPEEITALLESEEAQEYLKEKFVSKTDFDSVTKKKDQLLGEKKKEQDKAKGLQAELDKFADYRNKVGELGFDMDETFNTFLDGLKKNANSPEGEAAPPSVNTTKMFEDRLEVQKKTYESKLDSQKSTYEKRLEELQKEFDTTLQGWYAEKIENTLNSGLDQIGVMPKHKKFLKAAIRSQAKVLETEDGVRSVFISNEEGFDVPAPEYFEAFAQTEDGKLYIAASVTGGGGAPGGRGNVKIDYAAERQKALQEGNTQRAISLALQERQAKKR